MTQRLSTLLVLATTLIGSVPLAAAWNHDEQPTIASGGGPGAGWVSFKFSTQGTIAAFEANANTIAGSAQAGGYLFDANGSLLFGFTFTAVGFPTDGTLVDVTTPATGNVHMDTRTSGPSGGGIGIGMTLNDACGTACLTGTYKLLLWVAGSAGSWDWHMRGPAGTQLLGTESGSSTFLYGAEAFSGAAYAQSYTNGIGGRAALATSKTVDVKDSLYGVFYDANFKIGCAVVVCVGAPGTQVLTAKLPSGRTSVCFGIRICSYSGAPAGTYTFSMTGADASATSLAPFQCVPTPVGYACAGALPWQDSIILGGVDAKLPA